LISLITAFIPSLNPIISYEGDEKRALISSFTGLGEIEKYFESILSSFNVLGGTLFVAMLLIYASLIFYLAGFILNLANGRGGKRVIFMGSIVLMLSTALLFVVYYCINLELLEFGGHGAIADTADVWQNVPIGIFYYFAMSAAVFVLSILGSGIDFKAVWYGMRLNWIHRFSGGVHPTGHKNTRSNPIETLPPQKEMIYPLSQHIGAMCEPLVKVGDYVHLGQKIADSSAAVSAPIHSTVSGTVTKICDWDHPTGNRIPSIIVENDFEDNRDNCFQNACSDYMSKTPGELIEMIREAGIVGMGGAAFPTHVKLQSALGKVDSVIINAAECEPYLSSDHRVILEAIDELLVGLKIVRYIMGAKNMYVGIENNKPDAISLLHKRLAKSKIKVVILKTKYPQGGEKQLVRAVTGRVVPSGKLPSDVGCLVLNVDTVIAIYRAIVNGAPLMRRIVTVAGHGVERVGNVNVRIGTPFSAVLDYFGFKASTRKLIMGGPMMGTAQYSLDAPVIKGTSGLICMTKDQLTVDRDGGCIRCGSCVSACPMKLVPNYIAQYVKKENYEQVDALHAGDCIECGCCSFTCPAKIPLIQYMRLGKQKVNEMNKKKAGGKKG
ncbi:MAG: electron transport complex subunit RsxC, partial [Clostridia bacterium]|nr:electron transport complex subunit RsxC [Clostridia bacterium]